MPARGSRLHFVVDSWVDAVPPKYLSEVIYVSAPVDLVVQDCDQTALL